jgi:hypothetical protein
MRRMDVNVMSAATEGAADGRDRVLDAAEFRKKIIREHGDAHRPDPAQNRS